MVDQKHETGWDLASTDVRVNGLDVLRGLALCGILVANIHQMFMPWQLGNAPISVGPNEHLTMVDWFLFDALVLSKFLTIFSLLFGIGFAFQIASQKNKPGGKYRAQYLRRIGFLLVLGFVHGLYVYAADVLVYYAITALALLLLCELAGHTLLRLGFGLLLIVMFWLFALEWSSGLVATWLLAGAAIIVAGQLIVRNANITMTLFSGALSLSIAVVVYGFSTEPDITDGNRWASFQSSADSIQQELHQGIQFGVQAFQVPLSTEAIDRINAMDLDTTDRLKLFTVANKFGPEALRQSEQLNMFINVQIGFVLYYFWRTLALFMIGTGLVKSGFFQQQSITKWRTYMVRGLAVGLPLTFIATCLKMYVATSVSTLNGLAELLHETSVFPLAVAYAAAVMVWAQKSVGSKLVSMLVNTGRMALTNYLIQSLIMLGLFYGLSMFFDLSRGERTVTALVTFVALMILSDQWMKRVGIGPLEWPLRAFTALKRPARRKQ